MTLFIILGTSLDISVLYKLGFITVVGLGAVVGGIAVVHAVSHAPTQQMPELSWLTLWATVEASVAVISACLVGFRVIINQPNDPASYVDIVATYNKREGDGQRVDTLFAGRERIDADTNIVAEETELGDVAGRSTITVTRTFSVVRGHLAPRANARSEETTDRDTESQEIMLSE